MSSGRPRHVTLTGDLSGDYVVVEERPDGSLVVAPEPVDASEPTDAPAAKDAHEPVLSPQTPRRPRRTPQRPAPAWRGMFGGLVPRSAPEPATVPEILEEWGVELADDEVIDDFLVAEINGITGFVGLTTRRFIFAAHSGRDVTVVQEHLLSSARNLELVGRPRKQRLRVTWHGSESLIWVPDRDAFARLHQKLMDGVGGR